MSPSIVPSIDLASLGAFGDPIIIRDAAGRSRRPSLAPRSTPEGRRCLEVRGPFTIVHRYSVDPAEGADFVQTARDDNPIHTRDNVVPGAMTAARFLLVPELLLGPGLIERAKMRFRAIAWYGRPTVNLFRFEPGRDGAVKVSVSVRQDGTEVADGLISVGSPEPLAAAAGTAGDLVEDTGTARVRTFLASLRVDPSAFFRGAGRIYPRAFLASLPPGEMVRKYSGEGGILNSLELEFTGDAVPSASSVPDVVLEDSARARKTFRKVLARIAEGVRTFCSGFAMVLPKESVGLLK